MSGAGRRRLLVLGLGNVLCGDDGLGVAAVNELARRYILPDEVEPVDGGTLGLALMGLFDGFDDVLIADAVRTDGRPGTLVRLFGEEVAPAVRERLSVHQIGVADLLDGLRLVGRFPDRLRLLGLVPQTLELGLGLSPPVAQALPRLVEEIAREIARAGHTITPRKRHDDKVVGPSGVRAARALGL